MVSFISIVSLFILILTQNCLTVPIVDEQSLTSTISSLNNDLTTQYGINLQTGNDDQTTSSLNIEKKQSSGDEHLGLDVSTSSHNLLEENSSRAPRTFEEYSTIESSTVTTEKSLDTQRDQDNLVFTTNAPTTQINQFIPRSLDFNPEHEVQTETAEVKLTTDFMTQSLSQDDYKYDTSSKSTLKPEKNRDDYDGKHQENVDFGENDKETESKSNRKTTSDSEIDFKENSQKSTVQTILTFQKTVTKIPDVPNNLLTLVDDDEMIVTIPNRFLTPSTNDKYTGFSLNQGEKSSYDKEKESNN